MPNSIFNKKFRGILPGNYSGNLWQTFNIDLERNKGRITLSDKMRIFASGLGVVSKFIRTNATGTDQWFGIISGTDIIRNGSATITAGTWVTDDTTGTFNDPLDMEIHEFANGEQRLFCTRDTDIGVLNVTGGANVWDNDWWTNTKSQSALTSGIPHPIARLQRLIAIGDKVNGVPVIHTINSSDTITTSALSFSANYTVRIIYASSNRFWIGLQHDYDGHARIIEWNGSSTTYNNEYDLVGNSFPLSGFIKDDIPYFITEKGFIYKYTGGGFKKEQDFLIQEQRLVLSSSITANNTIGTYGCFVDGDVVYINFGAPTIVTTSATVLVAASRRQRSGIWIYNTVNNNLYHYAGLGEHASAGTDLNYGCSPISSAGAVIKAKVGDDKTLIASASVYTGGTNWRTNTLSGIYRTIPNNEQTSNSGRNRGYIITPFIPFSEIEGMWEALMVKFKKFVNSNNRIIVKWRVVDPLYNASAQDQSTNDLDIISAPITWASTTTFTCKVPIGVSVGDEVEVLSGDNAGCSFAISALSGTPDNTTLLTVTIAEAAPTSSTDTALVRFDNWKTETAISSTIVGNQRIPFTAIGHGEFIQLKIELRGFDVQLDDIIPIVKNKTNTKQI